jgi:hypothetical protein
MPAADTRENAIPTTEDIAFARARRKRVIGPDEDDAPVAAAPAEGGGTDTEMAQLRAELAELRKMVAGQSKAPTSARRIGDVADAEQAAEEADHKLAELIDTTKLGEGQFLPKEGISAKAVADAMAAVKKAIQQVDVARCLAGIIPKTHPGLRMLPADHPVFRVR